MKGKGSELISSSEQEKYLTEYSTSSEIGPCFVEEESIDAYPMCDVDGHIS